MNLSGVMLNINAEKAFVIFPKGVISKKSEQRPPEYTFGESNSDISNVCKLYAKNQITRKELVSSLAAYLKGD